MGEGREPQCRRIQSEFVEIMGGAEKFGKVRIQ